MPFPKRKSLQGAVPGVPFRRASRLITLPGVLGYLVGYVHA